MPTQPLARLVVRPTIYHQILNQQPTVLDSPTTVRQLASDEHPWSRDLKVDHEWKPLKGCWLIDENKPVSLMVLCNREGRFTQRIPTEEEARQATGLVVEVLLSAPIMRTPEPDNFTMDAYHFTEVPHPPLLLVPGGLLVLEPSNLGSVYLRCPKGVAKVTAQVYPG